MAAKPVIVPFWQRLRPIATYPFRGAAMYSLIALTAFIFFGGFVPGIVGWILVAVGWIAAFKYAFETLKTTADGKLDAPEIVQGFDNSVVWSYLALQVLTVVIPLMFGLFVSPVLGVVLYLVLAAAQPAAIMTLAMTQNLGAAIDPTQWLPLIARIGWPYLGLIGLMIVMQLSAANADGLLTSVLPWILAEPAALVFSLWALFATFHLMGYLLWQYHEALGFVPRSLAEPAGLPFNRDRELLDRAAECVQDGRPADAITLVRAELKARAVSVEVHELYRRLLRAAGDRAALVEHGPLFLHLLLIEKQERRALGLARECLDDHPDFVAMQPEDSAHLAQRAAFGGQSKLAIDLLLALIRKHPREPAMPEWTLRAVDLLLRQPNTEGQARALLEQARARATDEALCARLDAQLALLPA